MSITTPSTPVSITISDKEQTLTYEGPDPELFGVESFDVKCLLSADLYLTFDLEGQNVGLEFGSNGFILDSKTDLAVVTLVAFTCRVIIRFVVYEFVLKGKVLFSTMTVPSTASFARTAPLRLEDIYYIADFGGLNDLKFTLDYIEFVNDTPVNRFVYKRNSSELTSTIDACRTLSVDFNQREGNVSNMVLSGSDSVSFNLLQANSTLTYRITGSIGNCKFTPTTATLTQTTTIETRTLSSLPPITPPYINISGYLTHDLKNVCYFRVRTDVDDVSIYGMNFPSVILGGGCTIADKVQSLLLVGETPERNRMMEYCVLRVALSAQLVEFGESYSVEYLRRRYWKLFITSLRASEFASLVDLFILDRYQLVGYHRYFLC